MSYFIPFVSAAALSVTGVVYAMSTPTNPEDRRYGTRLHRSLHTGVARHVSFLFPPLVGRVDHVVAVMPNKRRVYVHGHVCLGCDFVSVNRIMKIEDAHGALATAWVNESELRQANRDARSQS